MITHVCTCGHPIHNHETVLKPNGTVYKHGQCMIDDCGCKTFNLDVNKTRFDTSTNRRNQMNERKDLQ